MCGLVSLSNRVVRGLFVPVARRGIIVGANIGSLEAPVLGVEGSVRVVDLSVVRDNRVVVTDLEEKPSISLPNQIHWLTYVTPRAAGKVVVEATQRTVVLLEDNCLCFDLANLLSDDSIIAKGE
jgi:hypothetical protein